MVTIGNTTLPGVQTTVESAGSVGVNVGSPANVGLVGEATLSGAEGGSANENEVYAVTTPVGARNLFGEDSLLTNAVVDALSEGAYPVYAVAAAKSSESEDISGISGTSGTLNDAPVTEDVESVSATVQGTDMTVIKTYRDPSNLSPASEEAYYNPVTGAYELGTAVSDSGTIGYDNVDYISGIQALEQEQAETVDFLGATTENAEVTSELLGTANRMVQQYNFAIALAGTSPYIGDGNHGDEDVQSDSSRLQEYYPTRNADDGSIIGSLLGMKASIGMTTSPMNTTLDSQTDLKVTLSKAEQESLVGQRINPIADESNGARVIDDMTAVSDENAEERSWRQGFARLVTDYVTEVTHDISQQFVGDLHTQAARNAMRGSIVSELKALTDSNAIEGFTVTVTEIDSMTANVNVGIDTVDPLRNVEATVTAGEVRNGNGQQ